MEGKDQAYFGYYGQFHNQQNMLSDQIRTGTYHNAIVRNPEDFKNKVVLDVGAGTGILSYFSAVAGAKTVYAVEASDIATSAKILLDNSHYGNKIHVLKGKMEEVEIKEKVDVIVSEPMGVLLVHERMMESFLVARDLYLKPGGKMYPSSSSIYLSPFSDHLLHSDTLTKTRFWHQNDFYGLDLNCLASAATNHLFSQPVVGCFDPRSLMANIIQRNFDFLTLSLDELKNFTIDLNFVSNFTGVVHGEFFFSIFILPLFISFIYFIFIFIYDFFYFDLLIILLNFNPFFFH